MRTLLETIARHSAPLLAASIVIGIALPDLAALLRPLLAPAVYGLLTVAMIRVDVTAIRSHLRKPSRIVLPLLWMNAVLPVVIGAGVATFGAAAGMSPGLAFAVVLIASAPSITAASAICYLLGLDGALALAILLAATALTPLVTPLMVWLWMGAGFAISPEVLGLRLLVLIGGSWVLAAAVRKYLGPARLADRRAVFDGLNVALLVVFAIGLMDGIGARFLADPRHFLGLVAVVFAIVLGMTALTTVVFWRMGPRIAGTIGYTTGFRNIALAIGALGGVVPADTWTVFAAIQFPIYLSPLLLAPLCRLLLSRAPTGRSPS